MRRILALVLTFGLLTSCDQSIPVVASGYQSNGLARIAGNGDLGFSPYLEMVTNKGVTCKMFGFGYKQTGPKNYTGEMFCTDGSSGVIALVWDGKVGKGVASIAGANYRVEVKKSWQSSPPVPQQPTPSPMPTSAHRPPR